MHAFPLEQHAPTVRGDMAKARENCRNSADKIAEPAKGSVHFIAPSRLVPYRSHRSLLHIQLYRRGEFYFPLDSDDKYGYAFDMTNEQKIAWAAGLLEGEGSFLVSWKVSTNNVKYPTFRISCNMCDGDVLERLDSIIPHGKLRPPLPVNNPLHKPVWRWNLHRREAIENICIEILPYMGKRRSESIRSLLALMKEYPPQKGWTHGTRHSYENVKCRCDECRAAHAERFRNIRAKKRKLLNIEKHGKTNTYARHGCRCEACVTAYRTYQNEAQKRYRQRRLDSSSH